MKWAHPLVVFSGAVCLAASVQASADSWPSKPVRLVVPYPPGASTDAVAREVAHKMSQNLGETVIVENRPGSGGHLGSAQVARSAPDGYTLLLGTNGSHGLSQLVREDNSFDPVDDFTALTPAATLPIALVTHPSVPATNANGFRQPDHRVEASGKRPAQHDRAGGGRKDAAVSGLSHHR